MNNKRKRKSKVLEESWTLWARERSKKELYALRRSIENIVQADYGVWVDDEEEYCEELAQLKAKHAYIEKLIKARDASEGVEPLRETLANAWGRVRSLMGTLDSLMETDNAVEVEEAVNELLCELRRFRDEL